jgi:hypothetical protein
MLPRPPTVVRRLRRDIANLPAPLLDLRNRRVLRIREQQILVVQERNPRQRFYLAVRQSPFGNAAEVASSVRRVCADPTFSRTVAPTGEPMPTAEIAHAGA